jgi:hypothetical protein
VAARSKKFGTDLPKGIVSEEEQAKMDARAKR